MTATKKQEIGAALADLVARYPQTFVLEKYQPHRPLKVGIAADLVERAPELDPRKLGWLCSPLPGASCICAASWANRSFDSRGVIELPPLPGGRHGNGGQVMRRRPVTKSGRATFQPSWIDRLSKQ